MARIGGYPVLKSLCEVCENQGRTRKGSVTAEDTKQGLLGRPSRLARQSQEERKQMEHEFPLG
jgi:hypothetical protein